MDAIIVASLSELIDKTSQGFDGIGEEQPWFRGEPNNPIDPGGNQTHLLPRLFRVTSDHRTHNENRLLQQFRRKAPAVSGGIGTPERHDIDLWLFLAQHVGLPTRLLDWTESLMVATYFALLEEEPVVWMLNPIALNNLSLDPSDRHHNYAFPLTWLRLPTTEDGPQRINIGEVNIRAAWEPRFGGFELPVAIIPTDIHPRMTTQRSCFTVHGYDPKPLSDIIEPPIIQKYQIHSDGVEDIRSDFRKMGITRSVLFPDLDGLARELSGLW